MTLWPLTILADALFVAYANGGDRYPLLRNIARPPVTRGGEELLAASCRR